MSVRAFLKRRHEKKARKQDVGARQAVLEEMFNDMYDSRRRIYKVNFIRGITFGAGSVLGGTVLITLIVWILSLFVNFPLIGDYFKGAQQSIEQRSDTKQ